ncbi:MAG: 23S rRNA (pseudouridine(1915)-N(3))-methyltransferase RlmH [Bacilli bacterium]|jgi:23S rRNA (pseudouridine1915-N3)-methyltransferase|nr:23S rRNA (pseudouridine(1915)-N(3))-methyltransferase RlmH [Bacilli bacterium]NLN80513.1 23S rRNA (pseudouridine(1915)-N(3))-methyltransferase RlmH [Erysipelotrichia bacterium]
MKIKVIAIGKIKEDYWRVAIKNYLNRLSLYTTFEVVEIKEEPIPTPLTPLLEVKYKLKEGSKILNKIKKDDFVVLLDPKGVAKDSIQFSQFVDELLMISKKQIIFVIGGSLGLSPEVLLRANEVISLGKLTFTHQMARVILLEQIYRAFKIKRGETYHK